MDTALYKAAQTLFKVAQIDEVNDEADWHNHLKQHGQWGIAKAKKKLPRSFPCLVWAEKHTDPMGIPNFVPWVTHWCFYADGTFSSVNT